MSNMASEKMYNYMLTGLDFIQYEQNNPKPFAF